LIKYETLYKRTTTGAIQIWYMETQPGGMYRTVSGQEHGKHVTSEWTQVEAKNVGKSNETSLEDQADLEVAATYKKKLEQSKYFKTRADVDGETFFNPMLAQKFDPNRLPCTGVRFYIQPKHNGVRCIAKADGLWSRKGKKFVNCPHIEKELAPFFAKYPDAKLDGELYNHDFKEKFNSLISSIKKTKPTAETMRIAKEVVELHLYDFPSHPGKFGERFEALELAFAETLPENKMIRRSPTWATTDEKTIQGLHKRNLNLGYEGTMVRLDEVYEERRTYSLMKYKDFKDCEYEIVNIEPGIGNWSNAAKVITLKLPAGIKNAKGGDTFGAGFKGTMEEGAKLLADRYNVIGKLGTVVYFDETEYGVPLFPIFHGVRDYE
jgi:DNA ligase-1